MNDEQTRDERGALSAERLAAIRGIVAHILADDLDDRTSIEMMLCDLMSDNDRLRAELAAAREREAAAMTALDDLFYGGADVDAVPDDVLQRVRALLASMTDERGEA